MAEIPIRATLKIARVQGQTDANGDVSIDIKVPGTVGQVTRLAFNGLGWFVNPGMGDWVEMMVVDVDGIMAPAGTVVATYTDTEVPAGNQGWFVPPGGSVEISAVGGPGRLLGGLYFRVVAHRGDGAAGQDFCANIAWGEPE